jgi:hypothetical protein
MECLNLVPADADEIDPGVFKLRDALAESLSGVHVEIGLVLPERAGDFVQTLNNPGLIIHLHDRDEEGFGPQRRLNLRRWDNAIGTGLDQRDLKTVALQELQRLQNGLVLDGRRNDVPSPGLLAMLAQSQDGQTVAFRRAAREDHFLPLAFHHRCHFFGPDSVRTTRSKLVGFPNEFRDAGSGH